MATVCVRCGAKVGKIASVTTNLLGGPQHCSACEVAHYEESVAQAVDAEKRKGEADRARQRDILERSRKVILTTTPGIDGHRIRKYLGIESVEFVIGTGLFSEVSSFVSDTFGQRSGAFEAKLRQAKDHAMGALKYAAAEKGANAVVAVDMDYTEFSGNRVALILNGTLVVAVPEDGRG